MKHAEIFALNEWLSDYPAHMSYDEILDLLHDGDDRVTAWQLVENYPADDVINNIDNTKCHFERVVSEMKTEGVFA